MFTGNKICICMQLGMNTNVFEIACIHSYFRKYQHLHMVPKGARKQGKATPQQYTICNQPAQHKQRTEHVVSVVFLR